MRPVAVRSGHACCDLKYIQHIQNTQEVMQINHTRQQLIDIASRTEQKRARQLAKQERQPLEQALATVLAEGVKIAGLANIAQLAEQRRAALLLAIARKNERNSTRKAEQQAKKLANKNGQHPVQETPETWYAWFDGSALPNPGKCRIACILQAPDGRRFEHVSNFEYGDSCDAEYTGLILALEQACQLQVARLQLHGDSQVVIDDYNQVKASKLERMLQYRAQAQELGARFEQLSVRWIPRHKNQMVDALTQLR